MKCIDCENMKIVSIENGCGASAKCFKTSKQGKSIYWAMTVVLGQTGEHRVIERLNKKQNAPSWCPIKNHAKKPSDWS